MLLSLLEYLSNDHLIVSEDCPAGCCLQGYSCFAFGLIKQIWLKCELFMATITLQFWAAKEVRVGLSAPRDGYPLFCLVARMFESLPLTIITGESSCPGMVYYFCIAALLSSGLLRWGRAYGGLNWRKFTPVMVVVSSNSGEFPNFLTRRQAGDKFTGNFLPGVGRYVNHLHRWQRALFCFGQICTIIYMCLLHA